MNKINKKGEDMNKINKINDEKILEVIDDDLICLTLKEWIKMSSKKEIEDMIEKIVLATEKLITSNSGFEANKLKGNAEVFAFLILRKNGRLRKGGDV